MHAGWRFPEAQTLPHGGARSLAVWNQPPHLSPPACLLGISCFEEGDGFLIVSGASEPPWISQNSLGKTLAQLLRCRWLACDRRKPRQPEGPGGGGNPPRLEETGYQGQKAQERTASLGFHLCGMNLSLPRASLSHPFLRHNHPTHQLFGQPQRSPGGSQSPEPWAWCQEKPQGNQRPKCWGQEA